MKYVLFGSINPEWVGRHQERVDKARAKAQELGITLHAIYYTQGIYDFVDIAEAADPGAVLAFSMWYARQGYGRFTTMPAFDNAETAAAAAKSG